MAVFPEKADVAIFLILGVIFFTELFAGFIQVTLYRSNKKWYNAIARRIPGMPHSWLFPLVWTLIYLTLWIALFLFYRNADFDATHDAIDIVTILAILNLVVNKMWSFIFFTARRTGVALLMTLFLIGTNIAIIVVMALNHREVEWILWLPYTLWCFYALYLNGMWLRVESSRKE